MKFYVCITLFVLSLSHTALAFPKNKKETKKPVADWTITGNVTLNANYTVTSGSNLFISSGATLTIPSGITLTNSSSGLTGLWNEGTIIIESGGFLTNNGDFHYGLVTVNGTFNNNTGIVYDCKLNITGTMNNNHIMIIDGNSFSPSVINNSGVFNNLSNGYVLVPYLTINLGGLLTNAGKLYGNVNITGGGSINNSGIFAPGNSPGVFDITGNYTATSSATHDFEIAGTSSNQYDRLLVNGNLTLNGTLNVSLINGFNPTTSHDLTIMTGNVSGTFSTVNIPATYALIYNSNSVVLQHQQLLPVTFISLNSVKQPNGMQLNWLVNSEQEVLKYDVERSNDGKTFTKIGSIVASGSSHYSFVDASTSNLYFYRIKSIDANRSYKYSSIIRVTGTQMSVLFKAFPSPAKDQVTVQHPTALANNKITIHSVDGKFVMAIAPNPDSQQTQINISHLQAGSYIFSYQSGKEVQTLKLVKH